MLMAGYKHLELPQEYIAEFTVLEIVDYVVNHFLELRLSDSTESLSQLSKISTTMRRSGRLAGKQIATVPSAEPSKFSISTESTPTAEVVARAKLESLEKNSISFRLLDSLLTHAPTVEGLNIIISDIITASAETNGLDQLAEFYITGLFMPSNLYIFYQ
jgi:hypothetical protein